MSLLTAVTPPGERRGTTEGRGQGYLPSDPVHPRGN